MDGLHKFVWILAHSMGRIRLRLQARWVTPLGGFILTLLAISAADYFFNKIQFSPFVEINAAWKHKPGDWLNIWTILAIYTIVWLLIWSVQARSRMVIEKFVNHASKDIAGQVEGLSMLLTVKLAQIQNLYRIVDEQRAIPTAAAENESIDATINTDNVEMFLKDAVSSQSRLSLGPLEIPVGTLLSLIGHIAQGPRIIGSFYQDKNMFILTARSTRKGQSFGWRVERPISVQATQPSLIELADMIDELACRIFTDMALQSTFRWRAAASFSEGLRAYRECLRTPKNRIVNLRLAEEKFLETLTEDTQFTLAYYNLGVVHTELNHQEAAISAFERAISEAPDSWTAYYALALSCYQKKQFYRTFQICKRVTDLKTTHTNLAKAYQLRTLAQLELSKKKPEGYKEAISSCKKAIKHAWQVLYQAEIEQQDGANNDNDRILKAETLLGICMSTLAKIYRGQAGTIRDEEIRNKTLSNAAQLLQDALALRSSDASYEALYHAELGKIYSMLKRYSDATHHLRIAARAASDNVEYWAELLLNHACEVTSHEKRKDGKKDNAYKIGEAFNEIYEEYLFQTIIDFASDTNKDKFGPVLHKTLDAYKKLIEHKFCDKEKCRRIKTIHTFLNLGSRLGAYDTEEQLDHTNSSVLKKKCDKYKRTYEYCEDIHKKVLAKTNTSSDEYSTIRYTLQIAQVTFVLGRLHLRLSKDEPSGKQHLQKLDTLLKGLRQQEEELDKQKKMIPSLNNKQRTWEWERGQILRILAVLYHQTGERKKKMKKDAEAVADFQQAEIYYKKAIEVLAEKHPREVNTHNLRSSLASVLSQIPDKAQAALQLAQDTITLDALTCKNYEILGDVYFAHEDFAGAIDAWKKAVLRKDTTAAEPSSPQLYMKLGEAYIRLTQSHHKACLNEEECQEAIRYMEHGLKYCNGEHVLYRLQIYYALGYFHYMRAEYTEAIKYLHLARSFDFAPCTSTFYMAHSHLQNKEYDMAIKQFRILENLTSKMIPSDVLAEIVEKDSISDTTEEASKMIPSDVLAEIVEKDSIGHIMLGEMYALALWGQAYTWADCDIRLPDALKLANKACTLVNRKEIKDLLQFPARYAHCKGWILYKLDAAGESAPAPYTGIDDALRFLKEAIAMEVRAEYYLHLALASGNKLSSLRYKSDIQRHMISIQEYCLRARNLSSNDVHINQQVDDLLKRLSPSIEVSLTLPATGRKNGVHKN